MGTGNCFEFPAAFPSGSPLIFRRIRGEDPNHLPLRHALHRTRLHVVLPGRVEARVTERLRDDVTRRSVLSGKG